MFLRPASSRHGQSLTEVSVAIALVALTVIAILSLVGGSVSALYGSINCSLFPPTANTPSTCTLPANFPLTGPDATAINPAFTVKYSGPSSDFVGGNQCTPECPWGAKFIGIPNFITGPYAGPGPLPSGIEDNSYDSYAWGIIDIVDKNQCTYGAIAEWLTLHQIPTTHTQWSPSYMALYPPIHDNAGSMYQHAVDAGYTVSSTPLSGALVVYRDNWISASPNGHLATVVGVSADGQHYTVIEQNVLYDELNDETGFSSYRWNLGGFDIRTASFPDPGIAGFIYGPPGTTLPTDPAIIQTGFPAPTPSPTPTPS